MTFSQVTCQLHIVTAWDLPEVLDAIKNSNVTWLLQYYFKAQSKIITMPLKGQMLVSWKMNCRRILQFNFLDLFYRHEAALQKQKDIADIADSEALQFQETMILTSEHCLGEYRAKQKQIPEDKFRLLSSPICLSLCAHRHSVCIHILCRFCCNFYQTIQIQQDIPEFLSW